MRLPEFWKTGVLVLALAGLGSYIWFVERKQEPKREGEREKVTLLAVDKAKAKGVTLATSGGDTIRVVKEGAAWKLVSPFAAPADGSAVESMLTSLEKLEADEVVSDQPGDLAQYGLATPSRTVSALVEGAKDPLSVQFGSKAPDGSSVYAKTPSGPKVYLVPSWVEGSFDKKAFDLRDRDLLHVKRDDVRSLEVTGPEGSYSLARTDAGEWAFTKPVATRAGRWAGRRRVLRKEREGIRAAGGRTGGQQIQGQAGAGRSAQESQAAQGCDRRCGHAGPARHSHHAEDPPPGETARDPCPRRTRRQRGRLTRCCAASSGR